MIISDMTSRDKPAQPQEAQAGDMLNMKKFNALPSPVTARLFSGSEHWIESLCVQTGLMRLDVCGQIDLSEFSLVKTLVDIDGGEHDPDDFWIED